MNRPTGRASGTSGAWRYRMPNGTRRAYLFAALVSAGFHVVVFFGFNGHHKAVAAAAPEKLNVIRIEMPNLKDLEEPERVATDEPPPPDDGSYAPSLMDAPTRIALPTDFTQQIDFASLIPPPDLNAAKVFVIPEHILHGGKLGDGLGNIFNLADLDRVPEPVVQPAPIFPQSLKREVETAKVTVEFIVDTDGRVLSPVVVGTTHEGFNDAAMNGVSRWRFRPGMKGGRKVNTRMSVPIIFRILTPEA